jgi:hypothetical protein
MFAFFVVLAFDPSDRLKVLLIAAATIALFLVAKRIGGGDSSTPSPEARSDATHPYFDLPEQAEPMETDPAAKGESVQPDQEAGPVEDDESRPKNIRITDWNFATFEVRNGPPDPTSFADDLTVNLYDRSSDHSWTQSYFVATPAGLEKMLQDKKWKSMFLPPVLVLSRYDVSELRAAILDDLGAMEEERGDVPPNAGDTAAAGER